MAKNDNDKQEIKDNYYELKHKAIDDLVNADSSNSPEVSEEELEKYSSHKKLHLPSWFTVVFIKFWFSASICYFFFMGTWRLSKVYNRPVVCFSNCYGNNNRSFDK